MNQEMAFDLVDATATLSTLAAPLAAHIELREKTLKVVQYVAKLIAQLLSPDGASATRLRSLAKHLSSVRRLIKLLRWVKYGQDYLDAQREPKEPMRRLLLFEFGLNLSVDVMQDAVTLEKVGAIPKGVIPKWLEKLADRLDLLLCVVDVVLASVKVSRLQDFVEDCRRGAGEGKAPAPESEARRKLALQKAALVRYVCDTLQCLHDARSWPPEPVAHACAVVSAAVAVNDKTLKALIKLINITTGGLAPPVHTHMHTCIARPCVS